MIGRLETPMSDEDDFWKFSVSVYDGVREICLKLQDRFGFDVNLLLFCCWRGAAGYGLDEAELVRILDHAGAWRANVVEPLRATRRWLKNHVQSDSATDLRQRVLALELESERQMQALIIEAAEPRRRHVARDLGIEIQTALLNLEKYKKAAMTAETNETTRLFRELLEGVFASGIDGGIVATDDDPDRAARRTSESESETR
jgi:uncharacterized protein (TIGR02444 family)